MEYWLSADNEAAMVELLELLGFTEAGERVPGVNYVAWPPGSAYEQWPPFETFNTEYWGNVLVQAAMPRAERAIESSDTVLKISENDNGPSEWHRWVLASGDGRMLKANADGDPFPLRPRMVWA